jgi:hypothetical protein
MKISIKTCGKNWPQIFVEGRGDIWNTNSEESSGQTSAHAFYASDKSPGFVPLVDKIAGTPPSYPVSCMLPSCIFGQCSLPSFFKRWRWSQYFWYSVPWNPKPYCFSMSRLKHLLVEKHYRQERDWTLNIRIIQLGTLDHLNERKNLIVFQGQRFLRSRMWYHVVEKPCRQDRDQTVSLKIIQLGTPNHHDEKKKLTIFQGQRS